MKKVIKFLFGWVVVFWKLVWDIIDPELNGEFFDKIDRDYFPGK